MDDGERRGQAGREGQHLPRKERYEQKIDGVIALIMAMGNALADDNDDFKGFVESGQETFFEW